MMYKLTILLFAVLLVGCSAGPTQEALHGLSPEALSQPIPTSPKVVSQVDPTATEIFQAPGASMTPAPLPSVVPIPSGLESQIEKARQDLAQRLGLAVEDVNVTAVIGQEFSANAFNCRKTTERIARDDSSILISGQSILLNASGRRYEYHASEQSVVFCRPLP
jgi:hypothetical protein